MTKANTNQQLTKVSTIKTIIKNIALTPNNKSILLLGCAAFLLIISWVLKDYLQASMALHMLVQIPLIITAGVFTAIGISHSNISTNNIYKHLSIFLKPYNLLGISGFFYIAIVTMYWMLPKALDQVLVSDYAQLSKYLSLFLAGLVLPWSYKISHTVIRLFFIGGVCWAMAIVGLLYQETDTRLCNFYLLNDQQWAGNGLVILAVVIPTCWIILEALQYKRINTKFN